MPITPETRLARLDISCRDCTAACCRAGMQIQLSPDEIIVHAVTIRRRAEVPVQPRDRVVLLRNLATGQPFEKLVKAGHELSTLTEDCTHLNSDDQCSIYHQDGFPRSCNDIQPGSEACLYARARQGYID